MDIDKLVDWYYIYMMVRSGCISILKCKTRVVGVRDVLAELLLNSGNYAGSWLVGWSWSVLFMNTFLKQVVQDQRQGYHSGFWIWVR